MDSVYMNSRETVIPYNVFKELKFEAVMKSVKKPYPKKPKQNKRSRRASK